MKCFPLTQSPDIKFPTKIVTEGITDLFNDSVRDDSVNMNASSHDQTTQRTVDKANKNQNEQKSKATKSTKRSRDSGEFPTKKNEEKRKKTNNK